MKTIAKLLLAIACVIMFAACSKSDDDGTANALKNGSIKDNQNPHDTKTEKNIVVWDGYWMPIVCDGVPVDYLLGKVTIQVAFHYKNGIFTWINYHTIGEATGQTGEIFTVKENDYIQFLVNGEWPPTVTFHFNLNGNQGSHYLGIVTVDNNTNEMSVVKFSCLENGKQ